MGQRLAFAIVLATIPGAAALVPEFGTVTLSLGVGSNLVPSYTRCDVWIQDGSPPAKVLDSATSGGCISGWEDAAGTVRCIDDICSARGWALYVNEALRPGSVWTGSIRLGDNVEYVLGDLATRLNLG